MMSVSLCLFVCVFVCPRTYLQNYTSDLHNFPACYGRRVYTLQPVVQPVASYMRTFVRCSPRHRYAYCTHVIRCCCCRLQTIKSCSPCTVSSLTSTSVRVSWPNHWWHKFPRYYTVICTSTPSCGTTRVPRYTYSTDVTGLTVGTYYEFRVTNDRELHVFRGPIHITCAGTTGLCQCYS